MVIGTASIIAVFGLSRAVAGGIHATIRSFGDPGMIVSADNNQDDVRRAAINFRDLPIIGERTSSSVKELIPDLSENYRLWSNGVVYDANVQSQSDFVNDTLSVREGRRIDRADVANAAHVALLSHPLATRFFGPTSASGKLLRVGGSRFVIIGVYDDLKAGLVAGLNGGDYIEIPVTTFHQLKPGAMDFLQVYPRDGVSVETAGDQVTSALRRIHGRSAKYIVQDAAAQITAFANVLGNIGAGLTILGSVALIVAGVGIMNVMLMSIAQRTREIGLRKAIGATSRDILVQFLLEAVLLSLIGGVVGIALGVTVVLVLDAPIASFVGPSPIPYLSMVSVAVGFSTLIGTLFGTYPAVRASRLEAVVALRS
jgi:putative ABC transport system permease protein